MKLKRTLIKTMDYIMLDCKSATLLVTKKLDENITFWERIRLKMHLWNCKFCYSFNIQSKKIDAILKITPDDLTHKCQHRQHLDEQKKLEIINKLTENQ